MDPVGFDGEDESRTSTRKGKKYKLPRKLLYACGAVNNASVPRKLRSAIKKRDCGSTTPPLPIARKQTDGVELLRKDRLKKFRLNMKQGHITKDEKEVAETLYALADLFSDATKINKLALDGEQSEEKKFTTPGGNGTPVEKDAATLTTREDLRKNSARVTLEIACLPFSNQSAKASSSRIQSELSLCPRSKMSAPDGISCDELATGPELVMDLEKQNGKNCNEMDKNNGLLLWPRSCSTGAPSFDTQGSCLRHPPLFENANYATRSCISENTVTTDKHPQVGVESKESWKRCSAHVYISRLIKVLQVTEKIDGMLEKPSQATSNGGVKLNSRTCINNRKKGITAEKNLAEIQNAIILNERLLKDQQQGSKSSELCSSLKQVNSDFLSLAAGGCDLDANDCTIITGLDHKQPKKFRASYLQSHNHLPMPFLLPQNGYSSTFHGQSSPALASQQVQLPPYPSSTLGSGAAAYTGQQVESHQLKGMAQFPSQDGQGGSVIPHILNWEKGGRDYPSLLNHAQSLFPHLDASQHLKYQPILPQQQLLVVNSSLPILNAKTHHHPLPSEFERNGAASAYYPDNVQQLQLLLQPTFLKHG